MNDAFQRVGLVVNSTAGASPEHCFHAAGQAIAALGASTVVTGPGSLGESAFKTSAPQVELLPCDPSAGRHATRMLARLLADSELQTVVVVGGDGTMADVAGVFMGLPHQPDILGIGTGSTNAGALVTCLADELAKLDRRSLRKHQLDTLEVNVSDGPSAIAFNDIVFSTTVVGTINGELVDLDATALLGGDFEPAQPLGIGTQRTRVRVIGVDSDSLLSSGQDICTIVIGFAEQTFRAKAITGGICLANHVGFRAGCLVADQPIAYFGATADSLLADGPIHTSFLGLDADDTVLVSGIKNGAVVCADGNPVAKLNESTKVRVRTRPAAITALTMQEHDQ